MLETRKGEQRMDTKGHTETRWMKVFLAASFAIKCLSPFSDLKHRALRRAEFTHKRQYFLVGTSRLQATRL